MDRHPQRRRGRQRNHVAALLAAAVSATGGTGVVATAQAQTSLTGSSLAIKSAGSTTLGGTGYLGTYLIVPAGGATVNFTVNATASAGATAAPHMNLAVADSLLGFTAANASATNYTTGNVTLPAGTYFVRDERDYSANVGVSRSVTVNNLSVSTVSGSAASFSNASSDANARNAADTYIQNFRRGAATVAITGPGSVPLLAGTPIQVDLARHAFNFGTEVPGNTPTDVNAYLGSNGTTQQVNYQSHLNQNFNAIVPGNAGKWQNNEFTRDVVTMSGVDQMLDYAQAHSMRARMHNLIWGKNSFNGQQPPWVLNSSNNGLLDQANNASLTTAQRDTARADLRGEISERISYYLNATRAAKFSEVDVYNESFHVPQYTTAYGYDNTDGIASIYNEAAAAAPNVKMFTNDYNIFQDGTDSFANWYRGEVENIRNAGGNVGGLGMQYYPNTTIGTANNQHSAARMMTVLNNLSTEGVPIALTEFGVKSGGEAIAPTVLDDSMRLVFGSPNSTGFMMWGFWSGEGLFAPGSAMWDANWNITDTGKKWQDLLGIADWDGNPNNAWDTRLTATAGADGKINFTGFYGDYYLRGQTAGAYDMTLLKGTGNYNIAMAAPPTWSLWNAATSGDWSAAGNWSASGSPNTAGFTAYFGPAGSARTVNVDSSKALGMLVFDSSSAYTVNGAAPLNLAGFNTPGGHAAAIYVTAGNHTITAPLALLDDTTITIASAGSSLTLGNLQTTSAAITKTGAGKLIVNRVRAGSLRVAGGSVKVPADGTSGAVSRVASLRIDAGAKLDITDNKLIVASADQTGSWSGASYTGVSGVIQSGRNGGDWSGSGIVTSSAAGDLTSIGVATAQQVQALTTSTDTAVFAGQTVTGSDTLVMYTYGGDANLDGKINVDDYGRIDFNVNLAGASGWYNGDFNYDGKVNVDDYGIIDFNVDIQGAPFSTGNILSARTVPEPSASALALVVAGLQGRRRRCNRVERSRRQ
jgi:GH35 family endo-1,4-beta-xylanase